MGREHEECDKSRAVKFMILFRLGLLCRGREEVVSDRQFGFLMQEEWSRRMQSDINQHRMYGF